MSSRAGVHKHQRRHKRCAHRKNGHRRAGHQREFSRLVRVSLDLAFVAATYHVADDHAHRATRAYHDDRHDFIKRLRDIDGSKYDFAVVEFVVHEQINGGSKHPENLVAQYRKEHFEVLLGERRIEAEHFLGLADERVFEREKNYDHRHTLSRARKDRAVSRAEQPYRLETEQSEHKRVIQ